MSTEDISTKYGIDTTDFKTGISSMNRALRVLNSDFAANAAAMGDWEKTASGLEARNKSLNAQMDVQKLKVQALKGEYERFVEEQGASSAAAQNAQIEYNKSVGTLNKMQAEVDENTTALDKLATESTQAGDEVQEMGDKAETSKGKLLTFGQVAEGIGAGLKATVTAVAALAAAVVGVGVALVGVVLKGAEFADNLIQMSDQTGLSTDRLQELAFIGGQVGVSTETIASSLTKVTRSMASAQEGTGAAADAFKALGVSVTDSNGDLLSSEEVFNTTIDALGKIENPAERDTLAMDIFGKSAMELNPLIKAGSAELDKLSQQAHEMGAVVGSDNVEALGAFSDTLDGMKLGLQGTMTTLASGFLPIFNQLLTQFQTWVTSIMPKVQEAIPIIAAWLTDTLVPALQQIFTWLSVNLPPAIKALSDFWTNTLQPALSAVWDFIVVSVIPAMVEIWNWLSVNLPPAIKALSDFWTTTLLPALTAVWDFLQVSVIPILQVVWDWLSVNLPPVIQTLADLWVNGLQVNIQSFTTFVNDVLIPIFQVVWDWIATNLPPVIQTLSDFWTGTLLPALTAVWEFVNTSLVPLFTALGELFSVALTLALTALAGLWQNILLPALTAIGDYLSVTLQPVFTALAEYWETTLGPALETVKTNILDKLPGAFDGIRTAIQFVIDLVKDFTESLSKITLPDWLTPGSPTPFELGLHGINRELRQLNSQTGKFEIGGGSIGSGRGGGGNISLGGITINVDGQADALTIGQTAMGAVNQALLQAQRARGYS